MFHASRWAEVSHVCAFTLEKSNMDASLGSKGDEDLYMVERLGFTCYSCYMDGMVR